LLESAGRSQTLHFAKKDEEISQDFLFGYHAGNHNNSFFMQFLVIGFFFAFYFSGYSKYLATTCLETTITNS
jgi:hypothetical protein